MTSIRDGVRVIVDGVRRGAIVDTFERWYADDVEMSENGADPCVGKDANREREQAFAASVAAWHGAEAHAVVIEGDRAAIEWTLDFTPKGGARSAIRQMSLQTWRDGKVVREAFYHG